MALHPDPQLADSVGNWLGFALIAWGALSRRKKQNELLAAKIDDSCRSEVDSLKKVVAELQAEQERAQTKTGIMIERMNHLDETMSSLSGRLDRIEGALPRVEDVLQKTLNFFERAKGGGATTLEEKPIVGSGGMTAIKSKEGNKK